MSPLRSGSIAQNKGFMHNTAKNSKHSAKQGHIDLGLWTKKTAQKYRATSEIWKSHKTAVLGTTQRKIAKTAQNKVTSGILEEKNSKKPAQNKGVPEIWTSKKIC